MKNRNFIIVYNSEINTLRVFENEKNQPKYKGTFERPTGSTYEVIKNILFANFIKPTEKWNLLFIHGHSEINYTPNYNK